MVSSTGGRRTRLHCSLFAAALLCLTVLAACGGEKSSEPSADTGSDDTPSVAEGSPTTPPTTSATKPAWPSCSDVWVADAGFPRTYAGCLDNGSRVRAEKMHCSSGQVIVTYAERFYAVQGKHVNDTAGLSEDADYRRAVTACLA